MTPMEAGEASSLKSTVRGALDIIPGYGAFFKPEFLLRRRFHCVVFGGDFHDADDGVSGLCRDHSISSVYCLDIDDSSELPAFRFEPTHANLSAVRRGYHTPSYAIGDDARRFLIVSDSDYYWGFAGAPRLVRDVVARNAKLYQTRDDIRPFLESTTLHDRRIGAMLNAFHDVCDETAAIA